jgi:hypothetical protein
MMIRLNTNGSEREREKIKHVALRPPYKKKSMGASIYSTVKREKYQGGINDDLNYG